MENTKEMSRVEQALDIMRDVVKNAILNEEIEMTFSPTTSLGYIADLTAKAGQLDISLSIAGSFVCYHSPWIKGLFDKDEDFIKLRGLALKYVRNLSDEDILKVRDLQLKVINLQQKACKIKEEINKIMEGGMV